MKVLSPSDIISAIRNKELSKKEVLWDFYASIDKYNGVLNAIVSLKDRERVLKEHNNWSEKQKDQETKVLNGLPLAIKDLADAEGFPTTYGVPKYKNNIVKQNSIMVQRLINNGAIIIGKTNTPEFGLGSHTFNRVFGSTANAYDISKTAGGSSGGAASAIAAGLIPVADGSDMMGSCRNPAAFTNIYGIRPTPGLIPQDRTDKTDNLPILSTLGYLGRTPNDIALMLDAVAGKHPLDRFSFNLPRKFSDFFLTDSEFFSAKIGWLGNCRGYYETEKEVLNLCETKLYELSRSKIIVDEVFFDRKLAQLWKSWKVLRSKALYNELSSWNLKEEDKVFNVKWEYKKGLEIEENEIKEALKERKEWLDEVNTLFKKFDFLTMPSAQLFPFDKNINFPSLINGTEMDSYHKWMEIVTIPSLLGLPVISLPVGFSKTGLPMGMQLIAKKGDDLKLLAFAKRYEEIFEASRVTPDLTKIS